MDDPWDTPTRWKRLDQTPLGRMVKALYIEWSKVAAANDNADGRDAANYWCEHLSLVMDVLIAGRQISREDRRLIYQMAWNNRHLIPPDLALYAALGGGICGDQ